MLFEWDESKRLTNLTKHHIDFQDATQIFDGPVAGKQCEPPQGKPYIRYRSYARYRDRRSLCGSRRAAAHYLSQESKSR